jgi:hypothetical protein
MPTSAHILQQAIQIYLQNAYPAGNVPEASAKRIEPIRALPPKSPVPDALLEKDATTNAMVIRLGQPFYPHMKIAIDHAPGCDEWLLRVDAHDRHLHAPPGSPDEKWLQQVRTSNQALVEKIEAAWTAAGLPTFKEFLRKRLEARKAKQNP